MAEVNRAASIRDGAPRDANSRGERAGDGRARGPAGGARAADGDRRHTRGLGAWRRDRADRHHAPPSPSCSADELEAFAARSSGRRTPRCKARGLKLDLTRGKPCAAQLDLSDELLAPAHAASRTRAGVDVRNYGGLEGLAELREMFAELLWVEPDAGGRRRQLQPDDDARRASSTCCCTAASTRRGRGARRRRSPSSARCPATTGTSRCSTSFGIEMVTVPMHDDGPDVEAVAGARRGRPEHQGHVGRADLRQPVRRGRARRRSPPGWPRCRPRRPTSGSSGTTPTPSTTSPRTRPRAPTSSRLAAAAGHPHRPIMFASTSKITYAGAGVAVPRGVGRERRRGTSATSARASIGPDKVNQLRHVAVLRLGRRACATTCVRHREIIAPKFAAVERRPHRARSAGLGVADVDPPDRRLLRQPRRPRRHRLAGRRSSPRRPASP